MEAREHSPLVLAISLESTVGVIASSATAALANTAATAEASMAAADMAAPEEHDIDTELSGGSVRHKQSMCQGPSCNGPGVSFDRWSTLDGPEHHVPHSNIAESAALWWLISLDEPTPHEW